MSRGNLWGYLGLALLVAALMVRILFEESTTPALGLAVLGAGLFVVYFFQSGSQVRGFLGQRSTREGGNVLGAVVFALGILILVNILATRFERWKDFTSDRLFSPAQETILALTNAPHPPVVWGFFPKGSALEAEFRLLMDGIAMEHPNLDVRYVDPDQDPSRAHEYNITQYGTVVEIGSRREFYLGLREVDFLTAVRRASIQRTPKVGFLAGHGEDTNTDQSPTGLREAAVQLFARGYQTYSVNMQRGDSLDSLDVLVIARQQFVMDPADQHELFGFVQGGGNLLILMDPSVNHPLGELLNPWGLEFVPNFIQDPAQREPEIVVGQDVSSHAVTGFLLNHGVAAVFPGVGELRRVAGSDQTRSKFLMWSSGKAALKGDVSGAQTQRAVAAVAIRPMEVGKESRLVVFGDSDFATNRYFKVLGNGDLFLSAVKWLADSQETIALAPRERTDRPVVVSRQQGRALTILFSVLLPVSVLAAGGVMWWRRR